MSSGCHHTASPVVSSTAHCSRVRGLPEVRKSASLSTSKTHLRSAVYRPSNLPLIAILGVPRAIRVWPSFAPIMLLMLKADVLADTQRLLLPVPLVRPTSVAESVHQISGFVATSEATPDWPLAQRHRRDRRTTPRQGKALQTLATG